MWFLACSVRAMTEEKVKSQLLKNAISSPGKTVHKKKDTFSEGCWRLLLPLKI